MFPINRSSIVLSLQLLLLAPCYAQQTDLQTYKKIHFEYENTDSLQKSPLIICVPGFTQHNRSIEFNLLKKYFKKKGFSYLIMNPPQHGEVYDKKRLFTWGEREVDDLAHIVSEKIDVFHKHSEVHLLGFSLGAKTVLSFAARPEFRDRISSVIAIAAPYQVGAINGRVLSNGYRGLEGLFSSLTAHKRSSFLRMSYMVFPGLFYGMSTKPAWIIQSIAAPTLLLHSSGDWLTNARHSKMLFNKAGANQPIALAFIKTVVHAEDMLTRDTEMIKKTFFDVLATWFKFIDENAVVDDKMQFNKAFTQRMNSAVESDQIYPVMEITELSRPTMHNQRGNIWTTQSEQNPAFITLQAVLNRDGDARQFVTIGGKKNQKILSQLQAGFAWADYDTQDSINPEAYLSLYHPFGSFLWARKLTYIHGMQRHDSRRILSADLAFLVVDFQLNYGTIRTPEKKDLQLYCTYPLIFSPNGNYFAGLTYSQFFDTSVAEKNFSAYIFYGPKIAHARIQLFTEYHFLKSKFSKNESQWRFGISINLNER